MLSRLFQVQYLSANRAPPLVEVGVFCRRFLALLFLILWPRCAGRITVRYRLYRHSNPFHRHDCQGRKSDCDRDRRLRLRARRTRRKEGARRRCRRNGHRRPRGECPELALGRLATFPPSSHPSLETRGLCQTNHSRSIAQIESSRACISLSPTWALNARCSTSSASARWGPSISSIPSSRESPSSLADLPSDIG